MMIYVCLVLIFRRNTVVVTVERHFRLTGSGCCVVSRPDRGRRRGEAGKGSTISDQLIDDIDLLLASNFLIPASKEKVEGKNKEIRNKITTRIFIVNHIQEHNCLFRSHLTHNTRKRKKKNYSEPKNYSLSIVRFKYWNIYYLFIYFFFREFMLSKRKIFLASI